MSLETLHVRAERGDALTRLIAEDGTTASGSIPSEHVAALLDVEKPGEARRVADAHAEGRAPPNDLGGNGGSQS